MILTEATATGEREFQITLEPPNDAQKLIDRMHESFGYLEGAVYFCSGAVAWVWPDGRGIVTLYLSHTPETPDEARRLDFDAVLAEAFATEIKVRP
jgi:hypothetical protein